MRPVGLGVLAAVLLISSCDPGDGGGVTPPPDPAPNPDCVSGTAVDHALEVGLDLYVAAYDANLNRYEHDVEGEHCFTRFERSMIDELRSLVDEGADPVVLQRVVDDYPVVGPATVWALRGTWDAARADQAFDPDRSFYDTGRLGWIDLARGIGGSFPGSYLAERGLEDVTVYPLDEKILDVAPPDWNPDPDETNTFLDRFPGCEGLLSTGESFPSMMQSSGDFFFQSHLFNTPVPIRSVLPPGAVVSSVRARDRVSQLGEDFTDGVVDLRLDVHPDDRSLIGFRTVYEMVAHVVPGPENITTDPDTWVFDVDAFAVQAGNPAQDVLVYVNPGMASGNTMLYDHTVYVREQRPELAEVGPLWDEARGLQSLDYLAAFTIPLSEVPRQFTAPPLQSRYADLSIHGCASDLQFD